MSAPELYYSADGDIACGDHLPADYVMVREHWRPLDDGDREELAALSVSGATPPTCGICDYIARLQAECEMTKAEALATRIPQERMDEFAGFCEMFQAAAFSLGRHYRLTADELMLAVDVTVETMRESKEEPHA